MKYNLIILLTILCGFSYPVLNAQTVGKEDPVEWSGFIELDHISPFKTPNDNRIYSRNQGMAQLELSSNIASDYSFRSAIEIREDFSNHYRNRIYLDEVYVDIFKPTFDLRIGKQIISWGTADALNPTDNINPIDFSDILDTDDETMGVLALNTRYYLGPLKLQGIFVPVFTPSVLPGMRSPWYIKPVQQPGTSVQFLAPDIPDKNLESAQAAFKLETSVIGIDLSGSYYYGWNDIYTGLRQEIQPLSEDSAIVGLQPVYQQQQVLGMDFATSLWGIGLRGEAAYFMPEAINVNQQDFDDPYIQYVVGMDHYIDMPGNNNLFIIAQWIHEYYFNRARFHYLDLNHIFQKVVMLRTELNLGLSWSIEMQGIYNIKNEDYYFRPQVNYNITNGLNLNILMDYMDGKEKSFFGTFSDNKRIQVKLKYNF